MSADIEKGGLTPWSSGARWRTIARNSSRAGVDGSWSGPYPKFHKAIGKKMPATQSPNYNPVGATDSQFEKQSPLTI